MGSFPVDKIIGFTILFVIVISVPIIFYFGEDFKWPSRSDFNQNISFIYDGSEQEFVFEFAFNFNLTEIIGLPPTSEDEFPFYINFLNNDSIRAIYSLADEQNYQQYLYLFLESIVYSDPLEFSYQFDSLFIRLNETSSLVPSPPDTLYQNFYNGSWNDIPVTTDIGFQNGFIVFSKLHFRNNKISDTSTSSISQIYVFNSTFHFNYFYFSSTHSLID